jgi:hypothetical protein
MKKPGKKKSLVSSWKGPYFYEISKWEGFSWIRWRRTHLCHQNKRMIDFGIDLKEISRSIMLHPDGGDWGTHSKMFGSGYMCGLELWIPISYVKMVFVVYICVLETNIYFIVCSSLELELIYVKDVTMALVKLGQKFWDVFGCILLFPMCGCQCFWWWSIMYYRRDK